MAKKKVDEDDEFNLRSPRDELFKSIRKMVIDDINSFRLDYLKEELTIEQYKSCIKMFQRLLEHLKEQLTAKGRPIIDSGDLELEKPK